MIFNLFFVAQTMIIAASALKRMYLYQQAYGLTEMRFLVWHFIVFMGLILLSLFVMIIIRKNYQWFMKAGFVIGVVYLMFLTSVNIHAKIAKVNIERFESGHPVEIDIKYLTDLSVDAYEPISKFNKDFQQSRINNWISNNYAKLLVRDGETHL